MKFLYKYTKFNESNEINWDFDEEEFVKKNVDWKNLQVGDILIAKDDWYMRDYSLPPPHKTKDKFIIKGNEYFVDDVGDNYFYIDSEYRKRHSFPKNVNCDIYFYYG